MICPMCISNAALAVAGAATSGGAAAVALRILRLKQGLKGKAQGGFFSSLLRRARAALSERHL